MALKTGSIILVDTNVLIQAYRTGCLEGLSKFYKLQTVEKCVEETQTGFQRRKPEETIDRANLAAKLNQVAAVTAVELAALEIRLDSGPHLDDGEKHLLAHANPRTDIWLLCSPDVAAIRSAHVLGYLGKVVSMENAAISAGISAQQVRKLAANYKEQWLADIRNKIVLGL